MALDFGTVQLDAFVEKLAAAVDRMERTLSSADSRSRIKKALDIIANDAKARIHNITGNLHDSIKAKVKESADSPTLGEVGVRYASKGLHAAKYAHLVEGGHGGPHGPADPHPFWAPAVEATAEDAMQVLTEIAGELADDLLK